MLTKPQKAALDSLFSQERATIRNPGAYYPDASISAKLVSPLTAAALIVPQGYGFALTHLGRMVAIGNARETLEHESKLADALRRIIDDDRRVYGIESHSLEPVLAGLV